jgi:hypothetical protein
MAIVGNLRGPARLPGTYLQAVGQYEIAYLLLLLALFGD